MRIPRLHISALISLIAVISTLRPELIAQTQPGPGSGTSDDSGKPDAQASPDTLFVFPPGRPLIDSARIVGDAKNVIGFDILFSASGLGLGGFAEVKLSSHLSGFVSLSITGSRNTDEFPDYSGNVPNKVNRLFTVPIMIGLRRRLCSISLSHEFRPYINAGFGPSLLIALPYSYDLIPSVGHAETYVTGGGFVGVGAHVGNGRPVIGFNARYFVIPYSPGLESIRGSKITQFGGLFLTMTIGFNP